MNLKHKTRLHKRRNQGGRHQTNLQNKSSAVFIRIRQGFKLGENGGVGALELAARYSHLDLTDSFLVGGVPDDSTVALNWYLNPNN